MYCSGTLVSVYLLDEILVSLQCSLLLPFLCVSLGQQQAEAEPLPPAQLTSDLSAVELRPCFSFPLPVCAHVSLPPFPLPSPRALASVHLACSSCRRVLPGEQVEFTHPVSCRAGTE